MINLKDNKLKFEGNYVDVLAEFGIIANGLLESGFEDYMLRATLESAINVYNKGEKKCKK